MIRRVRSFLASLVVGVLAATALSVATPSPAAATTEPFYCAVGTGSWGVDCMDDGPASTYYVTFFLLNPASSYTYSWTISGPYQSIVSGCTSTSSNCMVSVRRSGSDVAITGRVSYAGVTKVSHAVIRAWCGSYLC